MKTFRLIMMCILIVGVVFACKNGTTAEKSSSSADESAKKEVKAVEITVKTDTESINKGKELFDSKCSFCHDYTSTKTIVGPGLKGVLKNSELPVSRKPAIPENIVNQIKNPYKDMPSFSYLPEKDVLNIIAFLNTL